MLFFSDGAVAQIGRAQIGKIYLARVLEKIYFAARSEVGSSSLPSSTIRLSRQAGFAHGLRTIKATLTDVESGFFLFWDSTHPMGAVS